MSNIAEDVTIKVFRSTVCDIEPTISDSVAYTTGASLLLQNSGKGSMAGNIVRAFVKMRTLKGISFSWYDRPGQVL